MRRFSVPDFLNLGIAPPAPRGATAVAPRAALVPPFSLHDPFTRIPGATSPLLLPGAYLLPVAGLSPGVPFASIQMTQLLPNPYTGGSALPPG